MEKGERIFFFIVSLVIICLSLALTKTNFSNDGAIVIVYSCLVMMSITTFFLEHHFTKPTDSFASSISALLLISPLFPSFCGSIPIWYTLYYCYLLIISILSLSSILLYNPSSSSGTRNNKIANILKEITTKLGSGRTIFFTLLLLSLLFYIETINNLFIVVTIIASLFLLIDPRKSILKIRQDSQRINDIGEITGVQSGNIFIAKLFNIRRSINKFDYVEFKYSMDKSDSIYQGMIIDNYFLDEEQWVKIIRISQCKSCDVNKPRKNNVLYKIEKPQGDTFTERFVGIITEKSTINTIRFEYGGVTPVVEGNLVEIVLDNKKVLYQIIHGATEIELLESKNEAGFIIGSAIQLGSWDNQKRCFDKYGWVPKINTPVLLASEIEQPEILDNEMVIGIIPDTNYPVIINIENAVSHHTAILGVTGAGKSVFARNLIENTADKEFKVICVDFTNEYCEKLQDSKYSILIEEGEKDIIFSQLEVLSSELDKFSSQQNKKTISESEETIGLAFKKSLKEFLLSDKNISIFDLPDVSNSTGILEYTKYFFKILFSIAKYEHNLGKKVCVVLEEAHTVVPEWNFSGANNKRSQSLINCIAQIALQGRKYGVGFYVIAQRTANVSKTILTQCNSIIAFKQFDKTGSDFLANYIGNDMTKVIPDLKFRQAIAAGKATTSGIPLIFEVPILEQS